MRLKQTMKPLEYFSTHVVDAVRDVTDSRQPMFIGENGQARAVLQDIRTYKETQESLALLRLLTERLMSVSEGRYRSVEQAFANVRLRIK